MDRTATVRKIVKLIRKGHNVKTASRMCGVALANLYRWQREDATLMAMVAKAQYAHYPEVLERLKESSPTRYLQYTDLTDEQGPDTLKDALDLLRRLDEHDAGSPGPDG